VIHLRVHRVSQIKHISLLVLLHTMTRVLHPPLLQHDYKDIVIRYISTYRAVDQSHIMQRFIASRDSLRSGDQFLISCFRTDDQMTISMQ
jgi:hypothetical protein